MSSVLSETHLKATAFFTGWTRSCAWSHHLERRHRAFLRLAEAVQSRGKSKCHMLSGSLLALLDGAFIWLYCGQSGGNSSPIGLEAL